MSKDDDSKGAYNRTSIFKGKNYTYWKLIMYVHLLSIDKNLWCIVTEGPFIPKGADVVKHPKDWDDAEIKKDSYDLKPRNILISALNDKLLYSVSHHTSVIGIWVALQTLYEGTEDVKDSKINMFIEEINNLSRVL